MFNKKKIKLLLYLAGVAIAIVGINCAWNNTIERFILNAFILVAAEWGLLKTTYGKALMNIIRGKIVRGGVQGSARNLKVGEKVQFMHPECISIGDDCNILQNVVFAPLKSYGGKKYPSKIIIGNRVNIGAFDRIASMDEVIIEDDVLFAAFVHITDHSHEYRNIDIPIRDQGVFSKGPVRIKKGAWLAFGCHILSGVTIGEYSVVAANSVVTKNVPPYSVVAGNPAKIVSRYDFQKKEWVRIK